MFNPHIIRKDFPLFQRTIQGKPIVYLDSGATSLKPQSVLDVMWKYYTQYSANIHRGIYTISEEATTQYDLAREKIARFIGATDSREVIFTRGTTESLNLIAGTIAEQRITADDSIVVPVAEHHANFVPWQQLAQKKGASFRVIPVDAQGRLGDLSKYIDRSTKIFSIAAISNVLGTKHDIATIAHDVKSLSPTCLIVVDAAQAAPHTQMQVLSWNVDFVAFSGHKMLGPTGIGVLWGRYDLLDHMPPYQYGGDMIREVSIEKTVFQSPPQKFEAGTPDIAEAIGLGAAVDYLDSIGMEEIRAHEQTIVTYALEKMNAIEGITIYGPQDPTERSGVIAFTLEGIHPHDISQVLNEDNICIRAGHHCAMPLHTHIGVNATARASFYFYTTTEDIDAFIEGLMKAKRLFS